MQVGPADAHRAKPEPEVPTAGCQWPVKLHPAGLIVIQELVILRTEWPVIAERPNHHRSQHHPSLASQGLGTGGKDQSISEQI